MNLGEFHDEVSATIARGTAMDAHIPGYTRRAARWLERNYTFAYMKQFLELVIDLDVASTPRYIELGPGAPKSIPMFRWVNDDGGFTYLKKIDPWEVTAYSTEEGLIPSGYWLDGIKRIVLAHTPTTNLNGEISLVRYTPWPSQETFTHWLLDNAEDVLLAQTLFMMAPRLRAPNMRQEYQAMRDEGLNTLLRAEDEFQYQGDSGSMGYLTQEEYT